ncbi:nitroreductase/quinone reductase family protein [Dermatobacter hominis]|uniref:nitroreductase/quinone reductase family protein n=1 Tax=Dermatobacter hominis TaxID=2884263 RepID=UPI001D128263|nr:nitroreductase/quinone reductase family protein [Dermatobacter hominis]UDY36059.1 nitroreductase/quinone reductase family protein [Dermatobacter hominis]
MDAPPIRRCAALAFQALNSVVEPVVRRGWLAPAPLGAGLVVLGATGRRSGERSFRPLLTLRAGRHMVVGTVRRRSDWVANLDDDPAPVVIGRGGTDLVEADVHRVDPLGAIAVLRTTGPGEATS